MTIGFLEQLACVLVVAAVLVARMRHGGRRRSARARSRGRS